MKDIMGQELAVGNMVVFNSPKYKGLVTGKILKFSSKMITVEFTARWVSVLTKDGEWSNTTTTHVYPTDLMKVDEQLQVTYFQHPDYEEDWNYFYEQAEKFCDVKRSGYIHTDPKWACNLVTAVRTTLRDNNLVTDVDGGAVTFWWSW